MRYAFLLLLLSAAAAPAAATETRAFDWQRARDNYVAILEGRKQFHQLAQHEQLEVIELRKEIGQRTANERSSRERCIDEQRARLGSKKETELDRRHIDMVCRGEND